MNNGNDSLFNIELNEMFISSAFKNAIIVLLFLFFFLLIWILNLLKWTGIPLISS